VAVALLSLAVAVALSGCGSSTPRAPPGGRAVFAAACGACHSLVGNESRHRHGGDLLGFRMRRADVFSFTREMPGAGRLSASALQAVSDYVFAAQQRYAAAQAAARR
jgi:hypothetical protein